MAQPFMDLGSFWGMPLIMSSLSTPSITCTRIASQCQKLPCMALGSFWGIPLIMSSLSTPSITCTHIASQCQLL